MDPISLALLIASVVSQVVPSLTGVPKLTTTIAQSITATLSALVKSGVTTTPATATSILSALSAVVGSLQSVPGLDPRVLSVIADLDIAVQAAVAADKMAQQGVNVDSLQPIQPLPVTPELAVHPAQ